MIAHIEIYQDPDLQYRWRRRAPNGEITAQGEAHRFKFAAKRAARKQFPGLSIVDKTKRRKVFKN